ncbi:JNK1/MAPK8-associated membrane protein [Episyrphus balteatus]|uniref:JNK1/MAPK8-associated membrane protein n=1 Tax=Episyrphus balteatus TaxID=286459 RepID=UPI0024868923|nr:JNK1/MAPK8-associated membrane protein [Episyrphus balteatus]
MKKLCPGLYCGRVEIVDGILGSCGPCPTGFRINEQRQCVPCVLDPTCYDMLFLGFMFMLPLIMHFYFINHCCKNLKEQVVIFGSAVLELVCSAVISILLMDPVGSFRLHTCGVKQFSDWYTLFYNPSPNYVSKLHCTQEAVYPLQTMVLLFYFMCLVLMLIMRFFLKSVFGIYKKRAVYSAMYFFPILMFLHSMACGLIYYGFPYLSIFISMITNAWHQSTKSNRPIQTIFKSTKSLIITGGHWFFLAFGIVSLRHHFIFLLLVPIPFFFYSLTLPFTDPSEFLENED